MVGLSKNKGIFVNGYAIEYGIFEDNCAFRAPFRHYLNDDVIFDIVDFDPLMATLKGYIDFFTGRFGIGIIEIHDRVGA